MSTRCNVRIYDIDGKYNQFYRHFDGYLACTGVDLHERIGNAKDFDEAVEALRNRSEDYDEEGMEATHGDIEYLYEWRDGNLTYSEELIRRDENGRYRSDWTVPMPLEEELIVMELI
jgi:hypothetical protein